MLILDEIFMILKSSLFPFYLNVQTNKTVGFFNHCQGWLKFYSSHHYSYEPNFFSQKISQEGMY